MRVWGRYGRGGDRFFFGPAQIWEVKGVGKGVKSLSEPQTEGNRSYAKQIKKVFQCGTETVDKWRGWARFTGGKQIEPLPTCVVDGTFAIEPGGLVRIFEHQTARKR